MNYKEKYQKYKHKYLSLKGGQHGGNPYKPITQVTQSGGYFADIISVDEYDDLIFEDKQNYEVDRYKLKADIKYRQNVERNALSQSEKDAITVLERDKIMRKNIIMNSEYYKLSSEQKNNYQAYESEYHETRYIPTTYIKKSYFEEQRMAKIREILTKPIITPDEYNALDEYKPHYVENEREYVYGTHGGVTESSVSSYIKKENAKDYLDQYEH